MNMRSVVEAFSATALSVFMFALGMANPFISPFVMMFAPLPFLILTRRLGLRAALLCAVGASALLLSLSGFIAAVMFAFVFCFVGVAFAFISEMVEGGVEYLTLGIGTSAAAKTALAVLFAKLRGVNPFFVSPDIAANIVGFFGRTAANSGFAISKAGLDAYVNSLVETASVLMPSMLILFSAADTFVTYKAASVILQRTGYGKMPALLPFGEWRLPKNILWALLVAVAADLASKFAPGNRIFTVVAVNLMEVLRVLLTLQGLSIVWYYMNLKRWGTLSKTAVCVLCMILSPVSYILSMVGVFDIWYDVRRRIRRGIR